MFLVIKIIISKILLIFICLPNVLVLVLLGGVLLLLVAYDVFFRVAVHR